MRTFVGKKNYGKVEMATITRRGKKKKPNGVAPTTVEFGLKLLV